MNENPTTWTLDGFVEHFDFVHHKMLDHKFVWVLGAGASYASNIPLGSQLVDQWLIKMHLRDDGGKTPIEKWATAEKLGIKDFKYEERARFYPQIYDCCFREYPEEGYAYLESVMSGKDPSPGYSILAESLANDPPRHNLVITTNFDNLVADALAIYTDTFPLVCGHESLTTFVRVAMRRPLICKIHRDLLLGPQNDPKRLRRMHDNWGTALRALFQHYTPIFIGYGGNDDTLMDLLESMQPDDIKGQLIWCYYEGAKPSQRISNLVSDLNGVLVPVPDFDLLMVLLGEKMGIALMDHQIGNRATKRAERYRDRILKLDTVKHPSVTRALAATLDRAGGWWGWERKVRLENDPAKKEVIYRQAIKQYEKSYELYCNFAHFLWRNNYSLDETEKTFKKGLEINPKHTITLGNYATFLWEKRKNIKDAELYYKRSIEADPKYANALGNYALFIHRELNDVEQADSIYKRAIEADPKNQGVLSNYAIYCYQARKDLVQAEQLFKQAFEITTPDANLLSSYAHFFATGYKNLDAAKDIYKKSLELDPQYANSLGNYAQILFIENNLVEANKLIKRLLDLSIIPDDLKTEISFYLLAHVREYWPRELVNTKKILNEGARSRNWDFSGNIKRATELNHPNIDLLQAIADVISKNAPIETLDKFPEWQKLV